MMTRLCVICGDEFEARESADYPNMCLECDEYEQALANEEMEIKDACMSDMW